jgi:uncharacterized protein
MRQTSQKELRMRRRPIPIVVAILALASTLAFTRPAAAQTPDTDAVAAARELIGVMHAADQFKTMLPLIVQQLKPAVTQANPAAARDFDAVAAKMVESMVARSGDFADAMAAVYARHFTASELREITTFLRGPAGQKYVAEMPAIAQESMATGQKLGREIASDARDRIIEELRKRGDNP